MLTLPPIEEPSGLNAFPVLYWNHVGLEMNRITHSLGGPQGGPTMSSRALGLLHLAMHDAWCMAMGHKEASTPRPYLPDAEAPTGPRPDGSVADAQRALTGAAIFALDALYAQPGPSVSVTATNTLTGHLAAMITAYGPPIDTVGDAHRFGEAVAKAIFARLAIKPGEPGADAGRYEPSPGPFNFDDEPINPVRRAPIDPNHPERGSRAQRAYHGPYYGLTAPVFAVSDPAGHQIRDWRALGDDEYLDALREVRALGAAPSQAGLTRKPDEAVAAYYWAYDGANLIGTPPRLYNQILRLVAWNNLKSAPDATDKAQNFEFIRLFALANAAMADAGKFAWLEKYKHNLWRPLSGVRKHPGKPSQFPKGTTDFPVAEHVDPDADPFWVSLGAPETNTDKVSFKPPFPAYPSGHATFGAACFQMARLYYKQRDKLAFKEGEADAIGFTFVSEEMNGINRDLRQPYDPALPITDQPGVVRTRVQRRFKSLWRAIFENAFSRVWLGVHWRFDAFDAADALDGDGAYKNPDDVRYGAVWTKPRAKGDPLPVGGVPLGLGIANDIFKNGLVPPPTAGSAAHQAPTPSGLDWLCKISNTTY